MKVLPSPAEEPGSGNEGRRQRRALMRSLIDAPKIEAPERLAAASRKREP